MHPFFSEHLPPWLQKTPLPLVLLPPEGSIPLLPLGHDVWRVHTDGSVIGGCTGYGLVVVNSKGTVATCRGKLPPHCSIFQAEGLAILQALRYVATMATPTSSVEILADSRVALTASISATQIYSPFTEIREILLTAPRHPYLSHLAFFFIKISGVLVGECCLETTNNELWKGLERWWERGLLAPWVRLPLRINRLQK